MPPQNPTSWSFADDMGYSDIGCYGGEIATPDAGSRWDGRASG